MKSNAYLNGQDILNWYKTPFEMEFTDKGFPLIMHYLIKIKIILCTSIYRIIYSTEYGTVLRDILMY